MMRPWWKLSAQKAHSPRQPRLLMIENLTSLMAGDPARLLVGGVVASLVGQRVDGVHLLGRKRLRRWVLHDEDAVGVLLHDGVRRKRVEVSVLHAKAPGVDALVRLHLLEGGQDHRLKAMADRAALVHGAGDEGQVLHLQPRLQRLGDGDDGLLAHAVAHEVGAGVEQDRAAQLVVPVVVVREPAQRRLDAAQDDRGVLECAPDEVAVDDARVVGAQPHLAAGRVRIGLAAVLGDGVVVDHRVHVARGHEKAELRFAEHGDAARVAPVGLRDHAHLEAMRLEEARDDRHAKRGVVDVRVAAHVHEVDAVPAARFHLLSVRR